MDGESFYSINPAVLLDKTQWTYQDLKRLCSDLGLGGGGKRCELEVKLQNWHRSRHNDEHLIPKGDDDDNIENIPMNIEGCNFSLLKMNIITNSSEKLKGNRQKRRRSSIMIALGNKENNSVVSPSLLRPLQQIETPGKSILKQKQHSKSPKRCPYSSKSIIFSPFNKVRIIPHRCQSSSQLSIGSEREEEDDEFEESEIISPWGAKRQEMDVDDSDSDVDSDDGLEIFGKETDYTRTFS